MWRRRQRRGLLGFESCDSCGKAKCGSCRSNACDVECAECGSATQCAVCYPKEERSVKYWECCDQRGGADLVCNSCYEEEYEHLNSTDSEVNGCSPCNSCDGLTCTKQGPTCFNCVGILKIQMLSQRRKIKIKSRWRLRIATLWMKCENQSRAIRSGKYWTRGFNPLLCPLRSRQRPRRGNSALTPKKLTASKSKNSQRRKRNVWAFEHKISKQEKKIRL